MNCRGGRYDERKYIFEKSDAYKSSGFRGSTEGLRLDSILSHFVTGGLCSTEVVVLIIVSLAVCVDGYMTAGAKAEVFRKLRLGDAHSLED